MAHPPAPATGPTDDFTGLSAVQAFKLFFCSAVWDLLVDETNRYAEQTISDHERQSTWTPTDVHEMRAFVAHLTIPGEVVIELVKGLEYKWHVIYCDNYFNSPALVSKLSKLGFWCCGPVRYNTQWIPHVAHPKTNRMKKGWPQILWEGWSVMHYLAW